MLVPSYLHCGVTEWTNVCTPVCRSVCWLVCLGRILEFSFSTFFNIVRFCPDLNSALIMIHNTASLDLYSQSNARNIPMRKIAGAIEDNVQWRMMLSYIQNVI